MAIHRTQYKQRNSVQYWYLTTSFAVVFLFYWFRTNFKHPEIEYILVYSSWTPIHTLWFSPSVRVVLRATFIPDFVMGLMVLDKWIADDHFLPYFSFITYCFKVPYQNVIFTIKNP